MSVKWKVEKNQTDLSDYKQYDFQGTKIEPTSSTVSFNMKHLLGLLKINMAKVTAPETRTYTNNTTTKAYDSNNTTFYALNLYEGTNQPYSAQFPGSVSYLIVKPGSGTYSFSTPYKVLNNGSATGSIPQWTMSALTAPSSGNCTIGTTSPPPYKNYSRVYTWNGTSPGSGAYQTYAPVLVAKLFLEVWGASGGWDYPHGGLEANAGRGGYTYATYTPDNKNVLYFCAGERGHQSLSDENQSNAIGGWNGGGNAVGLNTAGGGDGGGCSHIATTLVSDGQLKQYSSTANQQAILIVAGAGGGVERTTAGYGGGLTGGNGADYSGYVDIIAKGGGQSYTENRGHTTNYGYGTNGSFGQGGDAKTPGATGTHDAGGAGGGGWYGGGGVPYAGGGGGGSSYIKSTLSGNTIAGNQNIPDPSIWSTYSSGPYESTVGHTGNGYVRITIKPYEQ